MDKKQYFGSPHTLSGECRKAHVEAYKTGTES